MIYRSALITGASSGIGAAFAEILPAGTALLLAGRNGAQPRAIAERRGAHVNTIAADLATGAGRAAVIERARQAEIDLLICNAGLGTCGAFLDTPYEAAEETIAVNILGTIELLRGLLPEMRDRARREGRRAGTIVVSSMAAFGPSIDMACYAATKAFGLSLAQSLAKEWEGMPIDILALCPTYTATKFFARAGHPEPVHAMAPEEVAREAMEALGRRSVHVFGLRNRALKRLSARNPRLAQTIRLVFARNPGLAFWRHA